MPLPRPVVTVPAYSYLNVHVDLWSHAKTSPIVQGSFTLDTDNYDVERILYGLNGTNAQVTVKCRKRDILSSKPAVRRRVCNLLLLNSMDHFACCTIEVFSLFICHQIDKDLMLYGIINTSGMDDYNIFERDNDSP
ncbi:25 kDa outer-membrane immunogenic protein [Bienertia sinuspersici]